MRAVLEPIRNIDLVLAVYDPTGKPLAVADNVGIGEGEVVPNLGVGDSSTAYSAAQTDLQASTNKSRKLVTSLSESSGVVTAVASWGTSDGNYEWIEWGSFNSSSGGTMLQRKVESPSLGTKTSAQTWTLTATLTFAAA